MAIVHEFLTLWTQYSAHIHEFVRIVLGRKLAPEHEHSIDTSGRFLLCLILSLPFPAM